MKTVLDNPAARRDTDAQTERQCREDEEDIPRRIAKGINDEKTAIAERLEDGKTDAGRLLKERRYALEDGLSQLAHTVKRHPIGFLGIAFAAGAAFGLLISQQTSNTSETNSE